MITRSLDGLFEGKQAGGERFEIAVRVDLNIGRDSNHDGCDCVSWDLFEVFPRQQRPDKRRWRVDRGTWLMAAPEVEVDRSEFLARGEARQLEGDSVYEAVLRVRGGDDGPTAELTINHRSGPIEYQCRRTSRFFRQLQLQVDVCRSQQRHPILPHWEVGGRVLTIESAFAEAGVNVTVNPDHAVVPDNPRPWTAATLHRAMERHFEDLTARPQWKLWCLVADRYEDPRVAGTMFNRAHLGSRLPERRGFAIFRESDLFRDFKTDAAGKSLASGCPAYLHTFVHEIGHALNLRHISVAGTRSAKRDTWMTCGGVKTGQLEFSRAEKHHLRHASLRSIVFGGDTFLGAASGRNDS